MAAVNSEVVASEDPEQPSSAAEGNMNGTLNMEPTAISVDVLRKQLDEITRKQAQLRSNLTTRVKKARRNPFVRLEYTCKGKKRQKRPAESACRKQLQKLKADGLRLSQQLLSEGERDGLSADVGVSLEENELSQTVAEIPLLEEDAPSSSSSGDAETFLPLEPANGVVAQSTVFGSGRDVASETDFPVDHLDLPNAASPSLSFGDVSRGASGRGVSEEQSLDSAVGSSLTDSTRTDSPRSMSTDLEECLSRMRMSSSDPELQRRLLDDCIAVCLGPSQAPVRFQRIWVSREENIRVIRDTIYSDDDDEELAGDDVSDAPVDPRTEEKETGPLKSTRGTDPLKRPAPAKADDRDILDAIDLAVTSAETDSDSSSDEESLDGSDIFREPFFDPLDYDPDDSSDDVLEWFAGEEFLQDLVSEVLRDSSPVLDEPAASSAGCKLPKDKVSEAPATVATVKAPREFEKNDEEKRYRPVSKFVDKGCGMSDDQLAVELAAIFGDEPVGAIPAKAEARSDGCVLQERPQHEQVDILEEKPEVKIVESDRNSAAVDIYDNFESCEASSSKPQSFKRALTPSSSEEVQVLSSRKHAQMCPPSSSKCLASKRPLTLSSSDEVPVIRKRQREKSPEVFDISSNAECEIVSSSDWNTKYRDDIVYETDSDDDYYEPFPVRDYEPRSIAAGTVRVKKMKPVRPRKKILKDSELVLASRKAIRAEEDRKSRLTDLPSYEGGVLDNLLDDLGAPMEIKVYETLWDQMRPHQQEGVRFMYRSVIESYEYSRDHPFGGCILAHSMGLGKTLQVLAFLQACLSSEALNLDTALVICPASTVLNWQDECERWMKFVACGLGMKAYELVSGRTGSRLEIMKEWKSRGGVLMISYPMYTSMVSEKLCKNESAESKKLVLELLQDPGPDVVVCDEAHELKNESSARFRAVNLIATQARIALTGTPMQNNLGEYYTMVNFIKPNLLGSRKEFTNRFVEPINAGSRKDAYVEEKLVMKKRSHILHETLSACLDLKGVSILTETLPPKDEHVIRVRMSQLQIDLYKAYIQSRDLANLDTKRKILPPVKTVQLLAFHPQCIRQEEENERKKAADYSGSRQEKLKAKKASRDSDDSEDETPDLDENNRTWFDAVLPSGEDFDVGLGPKVEILRELVIESVKRKEKILVFSDRKAILLLVGKLLQKIHREKIKLPDESLLKMEPGRNFLLLDGTTPVMKRRDYINKFNKKDDCHVFLLSIKAAGMGVNLVGASRVVLLEPMWNPTVDRQALFRTYRYGQTKPVHVYRLVTAGICEEKIFELQMNKQAMFQRVLEKKFGRGFDRIGPDFFVYHDNPFKKAWIPERPPGDDIVVRLLEQFPHHVVQTQNFDSLLEPTEQPLSFDESVLAWAEFEIEKEKNNADHMWVALFDRKEVADEMNAKDACDFKLTPSDVDSLKAFVSAIVKRLLQKKRNVGSFMKKFRSAKSALETAVTAAQLRSRALAPV